MYVLRNSTGYFIKINKNGGVDKGWGYKKATKFTTYQQAKKVLQKAPAKTSGYQIYEESQLDENGNVQVVETTVKVEKRKPISSNIKYELYMNQKGMCCYCGQYVVLSEATIDHIVPLSKGGKNDVSNLQCTCQKCNSLKASWDEGDFLQQISMIAKYKQIGTTKVVVKQPIETKIIEPKEMVVVASKSQNEPVGFFKELVNLCKKYCHLTKYNQIESVES